MVKASASQLGGHGFKPQLVSLPKDVKRWELMLPCLVLNCFDVLTFIFFPALLSSSLNDSQPTSNICYQSSMDDLFMQEFCPLKLRSWPGITGGGNYRREIPGNTVREIRAHLGDWSKAGNKIKGALRFLTKLNNFNKYIHLVR